MVQLAKSMHGKMRCRIPIFVLTWVGDCKTNFEWSYVPVCKIHARGMRRRISLRPYLFDDCRTNFETLCTAVLMPFIQRW